MFNLFKKRENPNRRALREEFEEMTKKLRSADEVIQFSIGHTINLAYNIFLKESGGLDSFKRLSADEQLAYISKFSKMEEMFFKEKNDMASSLGFGLFKMWLGALSANDADLVKEFSSELAYFSKKGDVGF